MASKTLIQDYPLIGDLCLSKNKLDIDSSGFTENNGVYYGNTLSPIFKSESDTSYDFYDKNGKGYKIGYENGVMTDDENNTLMQYDPTPFSEVTLENNVISTFNNQKLIEHSDHLEIEGNDSIYFDDYDISTLFRAKLVDDGVVALLYLDSNSHYHFAVYDQTFIDEQLTWTDIGDAIITSVIDDELIILSVFSDSGADFDGYANTFIYDYTELKEATFQNTGTGRVNVPEVVTTTWDKVGVASGQFSNNGFQATINVPGGHTSTIYGDENRTRLFMSFNEDTDFDYSSVEIDVYWTPLVSSNTTAGTWAEATAWINSNKKTFQQAIETVIDPTDISSTVLDFNGPITLKPINDIVDNQITFLNVEAGKSYKIGELNGNGGAVSIDVKLPSTSDTKTLLWSTCPYAGMNTVLGIIWIDVKCEGVSIGKTKYIPRDGYGYNALYPLLSSSDLVSGNSGLFYNLTDSERFFYPLEVTLVKTREIDVKPLVECNGILNNGQIINTRTPALLNDGKTFESGAFAFAGILDHVDDDIIYYSTDSNSLVYLGLVKSTERAFPYEFITRKIALDPYYIRYTLITKGGSDVQTSLTYDNGLGKVLVNAGFNEDSKNVENGSRITQYYWGILYSHNNLSSISYVDEDSQIGSLLTDWDYVDEIYEVNVNYLVYKNSAGNVIRINHIPVNDIDVWKYKVILNRFLLLNTGDFFNCYDTLKKERIHFASDYNDRILFGTEVVDYLGWTADTREIFDDTLLENFISGSAYNAAYQRSNNPIIGYKPAPNISKNVFIGNNPIGSEGQEIEVYYSPSETTATYKYTYKNGTTYKDSALENIYYPVDVIYSPNMFTTFIETWNLNDLVVNQASKTAYPLQKYNGMLYLGYLMVNGLENAENVFVVQTLYYMVSDGKIWEIVYDNGQIANFTCVANVKNMRYIGCLPTMAVFWSQMDRTFWSFSGDAILRRFLQANEISTITGTFYNTATQELFVGTDVGLLCLNDINNYMISDATNVDKMFFFENYFIYGKSGIDGSGDDSGGDGKEEGGEIVGP